MGLITRLWGITTELVGSIPKPPRAEVYCVRLNFNISKLVYLKAQSGVVEILQQSRTSAVILKRLFSNLEFFIFDVQRFVETYVQKDEGMIVNYSKRPSFASKSCEFA